MSNHTLIKKIKTPEGVLLSYFQEPGKNPKLHSLTGPAIKYPKSEKKKDVYAIYGREMSKREWLTLKNDSKVITPLPEYV
jgi:hypothetical protein